MLKKITLHEIDTAENEENKKIRDAVAVFCFIHLSSSFLSCEDERSLNWF